MLAKTKKERQQIEQSRGEADQIIQQSQHTLQILTEREAQTIKREQELIKAQKHFEQVVKQYSHSFEAVGKDNYAPNGTLRLFDTLSPKEHVLFDTAYYLGNIENYRIEARNGGVFVADQLPKLHDNEGRDQLFSVERLIFRGGVSFGVVAPIVLDLDGGGVDRLSASQSDALFDFDGDGVGDDTSWIGTGEGLLFLDRNSDGLLSDAGELSFIDDLADAASDLAGLRAFDSDGDGLLSAGDTRFAEFKVWRDANGRSKRVYRQERGSEASELIYDEPDDGFFVNVGTTEGNSYVVIGTSGHTTSELRLIDANNPTCDAVLVAARETDVEYSLT